MVSLRRVTPLVLLCLSALCTETIRAQGSYYLEYMGSTNAPSGTASDVWGWTASDGTEYAFMGYTAGILFVRTTPTVEIVDTKPGPTGSGGSIWRDFKTYRHYLYGVSEATGAYSGISVFDLNYLPDSAKYLGSFSTNGGTGFTCHNLSIDVKQGFAYLEGSSAQQVRIMSLANPEVPIYVGSFGTASSEIHDVFADNDTVYVAEGATPSWSLWNLANKQSPQMIMRISIPASGYVHNIWPSEDRRYCVTSEETWLKTIKIWDISDYQNVQLISQYLAPNGMVHNAHWKGDFHVNSHYESGVQLVDVSDPTQPVEWDRVDTYPANNGHTYNGCWGAFPFTQNDYVYASNINDAKLWVFRISSTCPLPNVPSLETPADAVMYLNQPYTFAWTDVGADTYDLQVDDDADFSSPLLDVQTASAQVEVVGLPFEILCHWRCRSTNACGSSDWSSVRSFTTGCVVELTGDVNVDAAHTSADLIHMVNYVFKSGPAPQPVEAAGDVNCSGSVASDDIVIMVNFTFKSGVPYCNVCSIL